MNTEDTKQPLILSTDSEQRHLKSMTNQEFMDHLMSFSPYGGLVQPFVIEALRSYCKACIEEPVVPDEPNAVIPASSWRGVAADVLRQLDLKYTVTRKPDDSQG
jgi:hypothetical protein